MLAQTAKKSFRCANMTH